MSEDFNKAAAAVAKPVEKLIEVVSSGIGVLYEPTRIKRRAQAEADAALIKIRNEIRIDNELEVAKAWAERRELRRFTNLDAIIGGAREHLPDEVSNAPVDPDWAATFFNSCQDVSNEQLQEIWSKILAGEIAGPGTYSLKTMEVLKHFRRSDAELFANASNLVMRFYHGPAIPADSIEFLGKKGLDYNALRLLNDLGLINSELGHYTFKETKQVFYSSGAKKYALSLPEKFYGTGFRPLPPRISFYDLTIAGRELYQLCNSSPDDELRSILFETWEKQEIIIEEI